MQLDPDEQTHLCPVWEALSPKSVLQPASRKTLQPRFLHSESVSSCTIFPLGTLGVAITPFLSAEPPLAVRAMTNANDRPMAESTGLMWTSMGEPTRPGQFILSQNRAKQKDPISAALSVRTTGRAGRTARAAESARSSKTARPASGR